MAQGYGTGHRSGNRARLDILGIGIDDVSADVLLDRVVHAVDTDDRLLVVNANAHLVLLAQSRDWLRALFRTADVSFCDGAGVQLASRLLHGFAPHRHTPPQWAEALCRRLAERQGSVFWLGGTPDTVLAAAEAVTARTGVRLAGMQHGYFDHASGSAANAELVARINAARPDLLLVTMGMPLQERWLADHWHLLPGVRCAVTAGALVDHAAGHVRRPPQWIADAGLEWLVRLAMEPRRLWRRYLLGLPRFGWLVGRAMLRRRSPQLAPGPAA